MVQEIKLKNCLSFKDEVVFSFEATRDNSLEDSLVVEVAPGVRLLRFAMVMGANGSGKSNLLKCFDFLDYFWSKRPDDMDESTSAIPFRLNRDTMKQPCEIEMTFWINGVKYWYMVRVDEHLVYEERLNYYKSVQPTNIFKRELVDNHTVITFNPAVMKVNNVALNELQVRCLNNMSVFASRKQVNASFGIFDDVRNWMNDWVFSLVSPEGNPFYEVESQLKEDLEMRNYVLQFLNHAGSNISDFESVESSDDLKSRINELIINSSSFTEEEKQELLSMPDSPYKELQFIHQVETENGVERFPLPTDFESYGTNKAIGIEAIIYDVLKKNKLLIVDEFDASMHPRWMEYCISRFLKQQSESQMLITSHCVNFLNAIGSTIRHDCVWFTEKGTDGGSTLYSLAEFRGLNKMSSILKNYLNGIFGAIPKID